MSELKAYIAYEADDFPDETEFYLKSEADKVIARYKYKRCLAMADKCVDLCYKAKDLYRWAEDENLEHHYNHKIEFFARWHNRWLAISEQFKQNSTAQ